MKESCMHFHRYPLLLSSCPCSKPYLTFRGQRNSCNGAEDSGAGSNQMRSNWKCMRDVLQSVTVISRHKISSSLEYSKILCRSHWWKSLIFRIYHLPYIFLLFSRFKSYIEPFSLEKYSHESIYRITPNFWSRNFTIQKGLPTQTFSYWQEMVVINRYQLPPGLSNSFRWQNIYNGCYSKILKF